MLKTNEYFDGKVKSIAFQTNTLPATVGVMETGKYTFNTAEKERITVVSGAMNITFSGENSAKTFNAGDSFDVEGNSAFDVKVDVETAYLCLYG